MSLPDSPGRPRDPEVDRRIEQAALDVYATKGWAGFSIEAVARAAGVAKTSIYLRWDSREQLLADVVSRSFRPLTRIDTGSVRDDLVELARGLLQVYSGSTSLAARRMTVEADATPAISEHWQSVRASQVSSARRIVKRAIERGELPPGTSPALVLDTVCGAAINHAISVPEPLRARMIQGLPAYADELVNFVLTAARKTPDR